MEYATHFTIKTALLGFILINSYFVIRANVLKINKNAFQYDAYCQLQWPSEVVVGVCLGGVCPGEEVSGLGVTPGGCLPGVYTSPCEQNDRQV